MKAFLIILLVALASQLVVANTVSNPDSVSIDSDGDDSEEGKLSLNQARCVIRNVNNLVGAFDTALTQIDQCTRDLTGIPQVIITQVNSVKQIIESVKAIANSLRRFNAWTLITGVLGVLGNLSNFLTNLTSIIDIILELDNPDNNAGVQCLKTSLSALQTPINNLRRC